MPQSVRHVLMVSAFALALALRFSDIAAAQSVASAQVTLHVDASRAPQGLLRMRETMSVPAGPLTLVYPRWIPGEHAPNGPIPNLVDIVVSTAGLELPWQRDPIDLYAFHLDIPRAAQIDVAYTFLGNSIPGYDTARLGTPNMMSLEWNKVVLTPQVADSSSVSVTPSITLPSPEWKFATALETLTQRGAEVAFKPTSLEMLVDSPLDAGLNTKTWPLATWHGVPVVLSAFADTPEELDAPPQTIEKFRRLVAQDQALYVNRHFNHYTFLLTLSDVMPGEGLEHHQSSDNGEDGNYLVKPAALTAGADLLPHEFNHSWDGKYRRGFDLATPNFTAPMIDDLLWVYEGMTQFYGDLQAERATLRTKQEWLDGLALIYARLDNEPGRLTDPLLDTARASSIRRGSAAWSSQRRGQDYYTEGELMWLEADALIKRMSGGKKSLDDVARAFFGNGHDTPPMVVTYNRAELIATLNAVQPYDWGTFFHARVDVITPHPPDAFTGNGYRFLFSDVPSDYEKLLLGQRKVLDLFYSLGLSVRNDGTVIDVSTVSPAYRAGMGPGDIIVAVNGRTFAGQEQMDSALRAAKTGPPMQLLVLGGSVYRTLTLDYRGGPRYPHLLRVANTADVLSTIAKPYDAPMLR